jgi:ribonuclease P protein component
VRVGHLVTKVDRSDEAHFPAEQPPEEKEARLSCADAHPDGPGDPQGPSGQRQGKAVGVGPAAMVMRPRALASRRDFDRVLHAHVRARRDGIIVSVAPAPGGHEHVGLIARANRAVVRNRIKRRLRAALLRCEARGVDAVVTAEESVATVAFDELVRDLQSALDGARRRVV